MASFVLLQSGVRHILGRRRRSKLRVQERLAESLKKINVAKKNRIAQLQRRTNEQVSAVAVDMDLY